MTKQPSEILFKILKPIDSKADLFLEWFNTAKNATLIGVGFVIGVFFGSILTALSFLPLILRGGK
jgi:hypothetical protein